MSSNLKYFYFLSFVLVVAATILTVGYGRKYVENHIIKATAQHINRSAVEKFSEVVWYKHARTLEYLPCSVDEAERCPSTDRLIQDYTRFFANLPMLSHEMYDSVSGRKFLVRGRFTEDPNYNEERKEAFLAAQHGEVTSLLTFGYTMAGQYYNVVTTYFPVVVPDESDPQKTRIPAVLELVYNITPFWTHPMRMQTIILSVVTVLFAALFGTMYYLTYKTEKLFTKQYEQNIELINAKASAEAESKAKSQFLANVSHELRTPLNAIIGFSEIIKDEVMGPLNNTQYKEYIADIHVSGVHLLSLINDILDYSKAEAGKLSVDLEDVDVTKIMKSSIRLVTPRANEQGVTVVAEIPKEHYILHTDGKRLKQVLLNLFSNSVKFTEKGGTVTLYAWHNVTDNTFVMEVQDTGVGIAPKDISKVMATFGQVENKLSRKYEGTGLGLPLSKKLVELMGGELHIESELGKGTTVSIVLPYVAPAAAPAPEAPLPL